MAPTGGAGTAVMTVIADVGEQSCSCHVSHEFRQRRGNARRGWAGTGCWAERCLLGRAG